MANFTCDICGGAIKMQGSQGGVCQNCGMEYDLEAIRAKANAPQQQTPTYQQSVSPYQQQAPMGFVQQPVMVQQAPQNMQQNPMDRQALLIYLNDLRTMETIIHENNSRLDLADEKTTRLSDELRDIQTEMTEIDNSLQKPLSKFNLDGDAAGPLTGVLFALPIGLIGFFAGKGFIALAGGFLLFVGVCCLLYFIAILVSDIKIHKNYVQRTLNEQENSRRIYDDLKEKYSNKSGSYQRWTNQYPTIKRDMINERNSTIQLLKQAYDANIIPLQFRTIEGVYYLYDYLSTSNQSLAEALMQANLEAIKQKIDQMIRMQSKMLIEQQQTNARLADIQQTNQNILKTAALTARYAQVAAVNSELAVKLSSKQLAYQRADFWLK